MALTRDRIGKVLVTAGTIGGAGAQWYIVWLFARQAGPSAVGLYSALLAIATPIFVVAQMGLRNVYLTVTHKAAWQTYVRLRNVGVLGGVIVLGVLGFRAGFSAEIIGAMVALKCADSAVDLYLARIQRTGDLFRLGVLTLANPVMTIVVVTIVTMVTRDVISGVWASAAMSGVVFWWAWRWSKSEREDHPEEGSSWATDLRPILSAAWPVTAARGLFSVLLYMPLILLTRFGTSHETGVFAVAFYLLVFANLIGASAQTVLLPSYRMARLDGGPQRVLSAARGASMRLVGLGVVGALVAVVAGPTVLRLAYGEQFVMSQMALVPLALAAALMLPTYVMNGVILVLNAYIGKIAVAFVATITSAVVGVMLMSSGMDLLLAASCVALAGVVLRAGGSLLVILLLRRRSLGVQ